MLRMKQFYGSGSPGEDFKRSDVLGVSIINLLEYLESLLDDLSTLSVGILLSYNTWTYRFSH